MLKAKPPILNNYAHKIKRHRLKMGVFIVFACLISANCASSSLDKPDYKQKQVEISATAININTASVEELERLPHIGGEYARRIVEHREKYGLFRRTEELLMVSGISDKKFREIRSLIKTE